jgi:RPA family protein
MRLSAELFQQIADALTSDGRTERDKRQEPRVGMAGEATLVTLMSDGTRETLRVRIRDISHSGLGICYNKRFTKDQRFIIQLQSINGDPIWLVCVTAYCRKAESDNFVVGGRIKQVLRAEQVKNIEARLGDSAVDTFLVSMQKQTIDRISKAILS